jgi:hypothetical protein
VKYLFLIFICLLGGLALSGCDVGIPQTQIITYPDITREDTIPANAEKRRSEGDHHPPIVHSDLYEQPVPLPDSVNTAGVEDSPFILPDGSSLYFYFTPDANAPAEDQLLDGVSGIWVSHRIGNTWSEAARVWLQDPGKPALDGAVCIQDDVMWFGSARAGYSGLNIFTAQWQEGKWANWQYVGDRLMKEIQLGELHVLADSIFFSSDRSDGKGGYDIWVTARSGDTWADAINIEAVNSEWTEMQPFVSLDGSELWFTRIGNQGPEVFRSIQRDGEWTDPELIVSQLSGEPTLDAAGNLYFVHAFYENGEKIETDIYMAYRK